MSKRKTDEVETTEEVVSPSNESSVKLVVNLSFTDKYNPKVRYKTGEVITVDSERADELLADKRNLVSKA